MAMNTTRAAFMCSAAQFAPPPPLPQPVNTSPLRPERASRRPQMSASRRRPQRLTARRAACSNDGEGGGGNGDDDDEGDDARDELVPDPVVWREFGISAMTGWRWTRDPELQFPSAVQIRGRNFRSRRQLEAFKSRLLRAAMAARVGQVP
jgi:hypothetical protein